MGSHTGDVVATYLNFTCVCGGTVRLGLVKQCSSILNFSSKAHVIAILRLASKMVPQKQYSTTGLAHGLARNKWGAIRRRQGSAARILHNFISPTSSLAEIIGAQSGDIKSLQPEYYSKSSPARCSRLLDQSSALPEYLAIKSLWYAEKRCNTNRQTGLAQHSTYETRHTQHTARKTHMRALCCVLHALFAPMRG